jgi:DNA-binding transcriptional ArsR family regulator
MTAAQLRALAHPLRLQLLQVLHAEGPATASQLARRLGE